MPPRKRAERPRDLAWEALIEATNAMPEMERGKLNGALGAIKAAWERDGLLPEDLPDEIRKRGEAYRSLWPHLTLTPTALATHWYRVMAEQKNRSTPQQALDELRGEE